MIADRAEEQPMEGCLVTGKKVRSQNEEQKLYSQPVRMLSITYTYTCAYCSCVQVLHISYHPALSILVEVSLAVIEHHNQGNLQDSLFGADGSRGLGSMTEGTAGCRYGSGS